MKNLMNTICTKAKSLGNRTRSFIADKTGDLATNTIGAIIVAVVIIGILVIAVNAFFPDFFGDMFGAMADKLNANW